MDNNTNQNDNNNGLVLSCLKLENYKKFDFLEVPLSEFQVIMGANGSGKTQILWAIILVLRSYNSCRAESENWKMKEHVIISPSELGLLLDPCFQDASLKENFIPHKLLEKTENKTTISTIYFGDQSFSCSVLPNGELKLSRSDIQMIGEKIRFAFVGVQPMFTIPMKETKVSEFLSSNNPNTRGLFKQLPREFKKKIQGYLEELFNISSFDQKEADDDIFVDKIEILFTGSALKKVFSILTLMFTLKNQKEKRRILLIEEPESLMYSRLISRLFNILRTETLNSVQVIVTSNCNVALEIFPPKNLFVLGIPDLLEWKGIKEFVEFNLLGIDPTKTLILCEGRNDDPFIRELASLLHIDSSHFQLFSTEGQFTSPTILETVATSLLKFYKNLKIKVLRGRDFKVNIDQENDFNLPKGVKVIYWDFPSIESYLFVYYYMQNPKESIDFFNDPAKNEVLLSKFVDSYRTQNKKNHCTLMFSLWTEALNACRQDRTNDNLKKIAKVIHDHTWVEFINSTTPKLINLNNKIFEYFPELEKFIRELLSPCSN